ncbi:MAG: hypothetical protein GYB67_13075 [Chloroflexi bacterium]|nr:hypothetical protein [Chloroflexota bacterium]
MVSKIREMFLMIDVDFDNALNTVYLHYGSLWTWDEYHNALDNVAACANNTGEAVAVVLDMSETTYMPPEQFAEHVRFAIEGQLVGWARLLIYQLRRNSSLRDLYAAVHQQYAQPDLTVRFASSADEAVALLSAPCAS